MGGQSQITGWARAHAATLVRVSLLLVCAGVFAVVARDLVEQPSDAAPDTTLDPALERANATAKWNAVRLAWNRHERAAANGAVSALREVTAPPALTADLRAARSGRRVGARKLTDARVWLPLPSGRDMIAVVQTATGSSYVVSFTRASVQERWRLATEVSLAGWPWGPDPLGAERRPVPFPIAVPLRALLAGRPMMRTAVAVPLSNGWTAICAGIRDRTELPPKQVCVMVEDDRPQHPFVLGRSR